MSSKPLTLRGIVEEPKDDRGGLLHEWRKEKQRLEEEILNLRRSLEDGQLESERMRRSVANLRQQLSPLHRALRSVFGEIELAVGEEVAGPVGISVASVHNNSDPRWESYKQTFPGVAARIIDALLAHPQLTYMQLKSVIRADYNSVKNAAAKLKQAGAIVREGNQCRLNR